MGATPVPMGVVAVILFAFTVFSGQHLVTGEEAEEKGTPPLVGYFGGGGRWRPVIAPPQANEWRILVPQDPAYYQDDLGGAAAWKGQGQYDADAWETAYLKRSPSCMSKCVRQGQIHPIMCHSLC